MIFIVLFLALISSSYAQDFTDIKKVDDNVIAVTKNIPIADLKAQIDALSADNRTDQSNIDNMKRLIDLRNQKIATIQSQIDQAAQLGVGDAVAISAQAVPASP